MENEIIVNGETYRRVETSDVNRVVLVVDRGWIFAGDLTEDHATGQLQLDQAVWVFRWESIGFDGVLKDPKSSKVTIRKLDNPIQVPSGAEIFRVPVAAGWGL